MQIDLVYTVSAENKVFLYFYDNSDEFEQTSIITHDDGSLLSIAIIRLCDFLCLSAR